MRRLIPNAITVARLLLVPVFAWAVLASRPPLATGLLVGIGLSDVVDGFLARRWKTESRFGALLDPIADKLTQLTGLVVLSYAAPPVFTRIPPLFVSLILARELYLAYGTVRVLARHKAIHVRPRWEGKLSTLLVFLLLFLACVGAPARLVNWLAIVTVPLVVAAGIHYTIDGRRQLRTGAPV